MLTAMPASKRADHSPNDDPNRTDWQTELGLSVSDPAELCRLLRLPGELAESAKTACGRFPLWVSRPFLSRIRPGDAGDPLLLQVLPRKAETADVPGFGCDPLGESFSMQEKGLLWKYRGRILVVATGTCAAHCRFCFRRHFPYFGGGSDGVDWERIAAFAKKEPDIHEVILSGGDPLTLADGEISEIFARLEAAAHVRRVRIHTRMPIMIPQRVTDELAFVLRNTRLTVGVVVHANHPAEIDRFVADGFARLIDAGVPVLAQGVLLRRVNDRVETLAALYERLVDLRVTPYYLHHLDPVAGAAHFEVPIAEGVELIRRLRALLPGYAVPRYVRETRGGDCKEILC
jgi:EF-P beta-lysylation protein EpmB